MSEFNYMDCYFEFQREFKPVEDYPSLDKIVESALAKLIKVLNCSSKSEFAHNIKLIYPNYFTEIKDHCFKPIKDDLIYFNDPDEELKERVLQHMSYYMTGKDTRFMRISKTLLENEKLNIKNFFVKKVSNNYEVSINGELDKTISCKPNPQFPVNVVGPLIKGFFKKAKFLESDGLMLFSAAEGEQEALSEDLPERFKNRGIGCVEDFVQIFESPLSAHYIMLQKTSLLYIYSQTAQINKNESSLGYGGMFILVSAGLEKSEIKKYICFFQLVSDYISICIAHNIMKDKQLKEATKSAKAAIMSRNMSHNLGSHVMSYLKQHLGTVKDIINDRILSNVINEEKDLTTTLNKDVNSTALPFLLGLGHFISYLQERQDFIATIATDYIPYYSTINFKDDIYDVLNPDKRAKRHPERSKTSNMEMDNILLGNIARSEGLGRPTRPTCIFPMNDNEVEVLTENICDIVLYFGNYFDGNPAEEGSNAAKGLESMRAFNFSLPGGIVGRQAFFSILENIIRNAAKHGKWQDNGELGLTFNIYKADSKNIPNNDNDNGDLSLNEVFQKYYFNAKDKDDLYFVTITDNSEIECEKVAELRASLQDKYVDASGVMRDEYKGLKEMRISSSWIRSMRDESDLYSPWPAYNENDNEEKKHQVIENLKHDVEWGELTREMDKNAPLLYTRIRALKDHEKVENRNLQYIFCVPIPKKIAIITREELKTDVKEKLKKYYWRALSIEEFKEESNKSFEFILCDDSNDEQLYGIVRPIASSRVYSISQIKEIDRATFFDDIKKKDNPKYEENLRSYEETLYKYLAAFDGEEKILIEDDRAKENVILADEDGQDQIQRGNVLLSGSPYSGKYIYRTHHEAYNLFEKFMTGDHSQTEFVEGISGNNSTDRLVRNETKDNIWFYRHLHAIKQHIAIFDERIYSRIGLKTSASYSNDHIATTYAQKNVFVFTLVEDGNEEYHKFGLYGIVMQNGNPKFGEKYCCLCDRLATLSYSKELGLSFEFSEEGAYICNKFDYISIHQGLLDKLYKTFGLKEVDENHDLEKTRLSNQLYILLSRKGKQILDQDDDKILYKNGTVDSWKEGFVPGLIIHSGRSKPSSNDMPQKLPFLQYAAIEHATLDCKFSLVELLDYARYEK